MNKSLTIFFVLISIIFESHALADPIDCASKFLKLTDINTRVHLPHFQLAPIEVREEVQSSFKQQHASGSFEKKIDSSNVKRVTADNLHNLATLSKNDLTKLTNDGLAHIEELSVVTSGAGLWSRGGGSVKALVPYNISEILGDEFAALSLSGKIVAAKNSQKILKLSEINMSKLNNEEIEKTAKLIKANAITKIKDLLDKTTYNPKSINTLDMKFINLATIYEKTGKYVSMDIWTSKQTHGAISEYLAWLSNNISKKTFHPDPQINDSIKKALVHYMEKSKAQGETHLFGYQEGLHAIDTKTGNYKEDTASIGKGAGAIIEYLDKSGRLDQLKNRGKKTFVFENIEVVSDYALLFASHRIAEKPVSVVLVPQKEGYVGGSPFLIKKRDQWNLELLEQSVLSDEFKTGNQYFNTNTIFFSADVKPPEAIGFELKEQNTIARVKQNMGDITIDNSSHGIGGRLGHDQNMVEYENFKSYDDYGSNGRFYINTFQNNWKETLKTNNNTH